MTLLPLLLAHLAAASAATPDAAPAPGPLAATPAPPVLQDEAAAPAEAEKPKWTGSLTVGASVSDGNTDISKGSATGDAMWHEKEVQRYTLGISWNYSEENDVITQRRTQGKAQYDRFLGERLYAYGNLSGESDREAGIDLRTMIGAGLGYQFYDTEKWKLSGEVGLGWLNEELDDGTDDDYFTARAAANWEYVPNETWSFAQSAVVIPSLEDEQDVLTKLDTRAKANISGALFAQLQWVWDWDNTPAVGAERSDHLYLLTVGWKF